ncbi:MAG: quinone-dependent dihydroorotate dehydrogenase [Alphaproteobacteria bacterium]|nr:quinone-dependent dihydroorotate dehydrogenase [Alphaproteobacteria bacterium]
MPNIYDIGARLLNLMPPETGHTAALWGLKHGFGPKTDNFNPPCLVQDIWGKSFKNPVAISAGFDKNAIAINGVLRLGAGFIEVGGVTPLAQVGNAKPRLFRLKSDRAAINRLGFNNQGADQVSQRITNYKSSRKNNLPIGINLAANSNSSNPENDFEILVNKFAPLADFLTIDISCPNSENGLLFLSPRPLEKLLDRLTNLNNSKNWLKPPALLVKISPDIQYEHLDTLLDIIKSAGIDGITVCNTTTERPSTLTSPNRNHPGGLSGKPLFSRSTDMLRHVYKVTEGSIPLIGVGGISDGADAYAKICAGASLVQLYTGLIYEGPSLIARIINDLIKFMEKDGFSSLKDAIGSEHYKS